MMRCNCHLLLQYGMLMFHPALIWTPSIARLAGSLYLQTMLLPLLWSSGHTAATHRQVHYGAGVKLTNGAMM